MERVDLSTFYYFGQVLDDLKKTTFEDAFTGRMSAFYAKEMFRRFDVAAKHLQFPLAKAEAKAMVQILGRIIDDKIVDFQQLEKLKSGIKSFEHVFSREATRVSAFTVTPKGIYDIEKLISEGEKKFPPDLLAVMPQAVIDDVRESGRCMAFELGTACAFHICRATEGLMRAYYKKLTGNDWPPPTIKNPNWKVLVDQLRVNGAPPSITNRLGELRDDRNSYAHPDVSVPIDEAPVVYETCTFVMFYIAKELR